MVTRVTHVLFCWEKRWIPSHPWIREHQKARHEVVKKKTRSMTGVENMMAEQHPFNTDKDDSHNEMPREPGYFTFASSKVGYYSTADAH